MSFFTTQLICIIVAQRLHTFDKNIPSECRFSDFPLPELKFIKFLMSFFKQKVSFSSKCGSLFSVMRDNSSVLFHLKLICFRQKEPIKCKFSDFQLLASKLIKCLVIFQTTSQFSLKFCITFQCHDT